MGNIAFYLTIASIFTGLVSAGSWLYASVVKVSYEKAMKARKKQARKRGEQPNYASAVLDGWDMSATFSTQSKWNGAGAFFAAISILLQAIVQVLSNLQ
ncbi:hypothetical protein KUA23_00895 [Pseudomonas pergaminensis]|uniref:Uncharacterized protein n=1 Tax=Pseudomonas pergaminensis TaxID=2853159 RepID=A0ABD7TI09_9PSED|nr:hypothetical protein [Pseudomonas pergaminensis]USW01355.1 hypothetical protein KUA23_00895 [Pseudomonas pergaminensis]